VQVPFLVLPSTGFPSPGPGPYGIEYAPRRHFTRPADHDCPWTAAAKDGGGEVSEKTFETRCFQVLRMQTRQSWPLLAQLESLGMK
jgi:hypothetical protein